MLTRDLVGVEGPGRRRRRDGRPLTTARVGDPAKAFVMEHIARLVPGGLAEWETLEAGNIRLRFRSGETFLLEETVMTRLR